MLGRNGQAFIFCLDQSPEVGYPGKGEAFGRDFFADEDIPEGCLLRVLPAAGPICVFLKTIMSS